eukprot:m.110580 g.110580  ORF g.110580 m.110580 type:complete len:396 (-) comp15371_c0_seq1:43-1230(-)
MKLGVFSLEFSCVVSGNGVLAREQVNGLLQCGHTVVVFTTQLDGNDSCEQVSHSNLKTERVVVSSYAKHLTVDGCWQTYVAGVSRMASKYPDLDVLLCVDWHGILAASSFPAAIPKVFACFRVFSNSPELCGSAEALEFYQTHETTAITTSQAILVLSQADQAALSELTTSKPVNDKFHLLLPPLRDDILESSSERPTQMDSVVADPELVPRYVLCCVRLSPEKRALTFANAMQALYPELEAKGLIPVLVGSSSDESYAARVTNQLTTHCPNALILGLQTPDQLAGVFRRTELNVHPALNDAYGMTIVEAAAFGVPTLLTDDQSVGAVALLGPTNACLQAKVTEAEELTIAIRAALADEEKLKAVGKAAQTVARGWTRTAYTQRLETILRENCFA